MPVVLVQGVPETAVVWDPLVGELVRLGVPTPLRLSPPGFGAAAPPDWPATVEDYRLWLVRELEAIGTPVDLVGHDWGGGHAVAVAMTRPDLLRTWTSDSIGIFHPDYVWHERARLWQGPDGPSALAAMAAAPHQDTATMLVDAGMAASVADRVATGVDDAMGRCIRRLYRSAEQPTMAELGARLEAAAARPGLVVLATEDHAVGTPAQRRRCATRAAARVEVLDGLGHWWLTHDPHRGADLLARFWASVPPPPENRSTT